MDDGIVPKLAFTTNQVEKNREDILAPKKQCSRSSHHGSAVKEPD